MGDLQVDHLHGPARQQQRDGQVAEPCAACDEGHAEVEETEERQDGAYLVHLGFPEPVGGDDAEECKGNDECECEPGQPEAGVPERGLPYLQSGPRGLAQLREAG